MLSVAVKADFMFFVIGIKLLWFNKIADVIN